jgi:predicted O-linked N-acetylglucosamine transferase (SPINDLY family)
MATKNATVTKHTSTLKKAVGLQQAGDLAGAERLFLQVIKAQPGDWAARYSMASICSARGDWQAALEHAQAGLSANPGHAKLTEALQQVQRALASRSADADLLLHASAGAIQAPAAAIDWGDMMQVVRYCEGLGAHGKSTEAMQVYRQFLAQHRGGLAFVGLFNLSVLQAQAEQKLEAEASVRQAIHLKPDFFPAHVNLGTLLEGMGRQEEAVKAWQTALAMQEVDAPEHLDVKVQLCNNLGRLLETLRRYDEAEAALERSLKAKPGQTPAISHWLHLRQKMCKWPAWHGLGMSRDEVLQHASALGMMALSDDPAQQLECAKRFVREKVGTFERMVPRGHRYGHDRLRIGFLSSDLSMHAVSLLTVEMFEKFDRSKVEVHAFCWSKEDGTAFRERVRSAFDMFHKIGGLTDEQAAQLIVDNEIDVVFDLQGITSGARPNIVARGPAPLQVAYLGYVGTSALPHVDHVIADKFIFPEELQPYFTEEPLYLPFFQVSDSQRVMGPKPTRAQFGLPDDAFVYCAFNNNYKITPELFESWMRILRRVPHGVLWLLEDNPWSRENLTRAAQVHGVEPERLHFAGRIDPRDYLARFTVADLFLDTNPYGAGTTANDALWAGLPVLTMPGRTYVSRMAGAILKAMRLDELIAQSAADYEDHAVRVAQQPEALAALRAAVQSTEHRSRIFDTAETCRRMTAPIQDALQGDASGRVKPGAKTAGAKTAGAKTSAAAKID